MSEIIKDALAKIELPLQAIRRELPWINFQKDFSESERINVLNNIQRILWFLDSEMLIFSSTPWDINVIMAHHIKWLVHDIMFNFYEDWNITLVSLNKLIESRLSESEIQAFLP